MASAGSRQQAAVAEEAARLIQEQGIDFRQAKHKAATRLGLTQQRALPSNQQIEARLRDRQRLFAADEHSQDLNHLRRLALVLMEELSGFSPRAVGGLASGVLSPAAAIELHVFADAVESVCEYLGRLGYRWENTQRRLSFRKGERQPFPALLIAVEDVAAELVVFRAEGIRQAPLSPVDGRPMQRVNAAQLAALVALSALAFG